MDTALDRENYINIMLYPFVGREEPLLHFVSYLFGFVFKNAVIKLTMIQLFFITILFLILFKKYRFYNFNGFVKTLFTLLILFSVFSNMLGVQLRIGYATILFLYFAVFLKLKPDFKNIIFYLIPCLMHVGVIPSVIIYYLFYFFRINSKYRFYLLLISTIIFSTITISFLPILFQALDISVYYLMYIEGNEGLGRALPFSVLFYSLFSFVSLYYLSDRCKNDINFWFGNFGLVLVYIGLVLEFYVAFKMLIPLSLYMYIYVLNRINFDNKNLMFILIVTLVIMPLSFLMLTNQVDLIL